MAQHIMIRVSDDQRQVLQRCADACGLPLSAWVREVALAAAEASPLRTHMDRAVRAAKAGRKRGK